MFPTWANFIFQFLLPPFLVVSVSRNPIRRAFGGLICDSDETSMTCFSRPMDVSGLNGGAGDANCGAAKWLD